MDLFTEVPLEELTFNTNGLISPMIFDQKGDIKYSSPYEISWKTLELVFAKNILRKELSNNLRLLISNLVNNDIHLVRIFIGGSYISTKPKPNDLDILICWMPKERLKNKQERDNYLASRTHLFDYKSIFKNYKIQVNFHGLICSPDVAVNIVSKWTILNSYSREYDCHRGIISLGQGNLNKIIK
jgi:hypothetical protein